MNWYVLYAVVGIAVFAIAVVIADRRGIRAVHLALLAGLLWPVVLLGLLQLALWPGLAKVRRGEQVQPLSRQPADR